MTTQQQKLAEEDARWGLYLKISDVYYKVIILIVGSIVAAGFLVLQNRQADSHYYADLAAQRERADTELRAEMFKILFEAYFKNKIQTEGIDKEPRQSLPAKSAALLPRPRNVLEGLTQETMLADLLARNFDNVDVRPLLEDLDARLVQQVHAKAVNENAPPTALQHAAFKQRELLRRVAIGATSRQIAALEGLAGPAKASVTYHGVDTCAYEPSEGSDKSIQIGDLTSLVNPQFPPALLEQIGPIKISRLRDGELDLKIFKMDRQENTTDTGVATEINVGVTFFDMPALENIRLRDGGRVAFSLYEFFSMRDCEKFQSDGDEKFQQLCEYYRERSSREDCAVVQFRTVILEKNFLGIHDRPYVNDLVAGKYRDRPWWKLF